MYKRQSQYFREGVPHDNKVSQMIAHAYAFDVIVCQSEFEAVSYTHLRSRVSCRRAGASSGITRTTG